jgi:hypothetical protein
MDRFGETAGAGTGSNQYLTHKAAKKGANSRIPAVATRGVVTANAGDDVKSVIGLKERTRVLVDTVELSVPLEDEELILRIELFESVARARHYSARVWRLEFYRIQSTFPQANGGRPVHEPSDELILKEFEGFESPLEEPVEFADHLAARNFMLEHLAQWLTLQLGMRAQWEASPGV